MRKTESHLNSGTNKTMNIIPNGGKNMNNQVPTNGTRNNKFYPLLFAIVSFAYLLIAGIINYFVNPEEKLWLNLAFVLPMVIYSLFTLFIHKAKIKNVKASDIYLPAIVYLAVDLICSYGFVLIYPDMFLTKAYWANLWIYILTAICIVILTVITKIPRKRFVILSYIGVLILVFYAITSAVMLCISKIKVTPGTGTLLDILLMIRENIIN